MRLFMILVLTVLFSTAAMGQQSTPAEDYAKANALIAEEKYAEAEAVLDKAYERAAGRELRADIMLAVGKARFHLEEFEEAEANFEKSLAIRKESHSVSLYYLGLLQIKKDEPAAATKFLNLAIRADSENAEAWFELGSILHKQGSIARAQLALETAIELGSARSDEAKAKIAAIKLKSVEPESI